jgi:hypothetical protein
MSNESADAPIGLVAVHLDHSTGANHGPTGPARRAPEALGS